ncbi:MAG: methyltransferase [Roseivirga sp.]
MANSFFKFKEFTIHQDQCGMKVTTDGCLFGALIAEHIQKKAQPAKILDIGTGTGLLSLMLAQVSDSQIDALEIDKQAYAQAKANFETSPWPEQLRISHLSFQHFVKDRVLPLPHVDSSNHQHLDSYDLIVCNPPFFSGHLTGKSDAKNKAVHDQDDLLKALPQGIDGLLTQDGASFVLLPEYEMLVFSSAMRLAGLFPQKEIIVYHKAGKPVFRRVVAFGRVERDEVLTEQLYIHAGASPYSERFTQLLHPYYLHL